jgi:hypothetical protein
MAGKPLDDPNKTRDQETAEKKRAFLAYFRAWPVKKAAAEAVNRSSDTIDIWLRDDPEFSEAFLSARAEWAKKQSRRLDPANLLTNMYPDELKPPKQEIDTKVTTIEGQSAEDLLAEARKLGLDTSAYESLLTGNSTPGTPPESTPKEGT